MSKRFTYWNSFASTPPTTYLLDTAYGGGATFAWFPFILSASFSDPLCIIRRGSDNAQASFYLDANGFLSANSETSLGVSIATFCSGTTGYLVTGYSQVGDGENFTASSAANQAIIFESGAMVSLNGQSATRSVRNVHRYVLSSTFTVRSAFCVAKIDTYWTVAYQLASSFTGLNLGGTFAKICVFLSNVAYLLTGILNTNSNLISYLLKQGIWVNGNSESVGTMANDITVNRYLGRSDNPNLGLTGLSSGFVIYTDDRNAQRADIEANINSNYTPSIL